MGLPNQAPSLSIFFLQFSTIIQVKIFELPVVAKRLLAIIKDIQSIIVVQWGSAMAKLLESLQPDLNLSPTSVNQF